MPDPITEPTSTPTRPAEGEAAGPPEVLEASAVLEPGEVREPGEGDAEHRVDETVNHPAKVMRIGTMMKQLLDEVRAATLDDPSRDRLREIYETSIEELGSSLSPDLREELGRLASPFSGDDTPSTPELQVAKAQLVGWLEGLVQGMQAMLFAQQMAAQQQLQTMRGQIGPGPDQPSAPPPDERPGTYL